MLAQSSWELWTLGGIYGNAESSGLFPVLIAVVLLVLGLVGFVIFKGTKDDETVEDEFAESSGIHSSHIPQKTGYRVIVTLSNPANLPQLLTMANAIASERGGGEVIGLRIALVPEQISPNRDNISEQLYVTRERPILEMANRFAEENNIPFRSQIEVGHNAAQTIVNSTRALEGDLIIMGWKGFTTTRERILGEVADNVVQNTPTDLMLVKLVAGNRLENWLLPTAGGRHAIAAEEYAASLVRSTNGTLTVCSVVSPNVGKSFLEGTKEILKKAVERVSKTNGIKVNSKIIENESINRGILAESSNYDAVMLGATEHRFKKILFGSIPEVIAKESLKTVVLVKQKK